MEQKIRNTQFKENKGLSLRKIIAVISVIICLILVVPLGISVLNGETFTEDITTESLYQDKISYWPMVIVSESMEPTIMTFSISICTNATIEDIEVGDIVIFEWGREQVAHRCIEKGFDEWENKQYITTKGDNNKVADPVLIYDEMIKGEIVKTYNEVAPILGQFMLPDKTLNTVAFTKVAILSLVVIGLVAAFIHWLSTFFIGYCKTILGDNFYNKEVARYLSDLEKFSKHKDKLIEYAENDLEGKKVSFRLRCARARIMREIKLNSESIKDFDKRIGRVEKRIEKYRQKHNKLEK